jgi:hypothetical protein
MAEIGPLDPLDGARVELVRAQAALYPTYRQDAPRLLVRAARRLAPLDAALSRETYLAAIQAAAYAGRLGDNEGLRGAAEAALAAPPAPEPPRGVDLLLDGLVSRLVGGGAAGSASLKQAVTAFRTEPGIRWLWMVMLTAMDLGDDDTWQVQVSRQGQAAREPGSVAVLPVALIHLAMLRTLSGNFDDAAAVIQEADAIGSAIGAPPGPLAPLILAAFRGRLDETTALIDNALRNATTSGRA